jgi:hypothetical protein
VPGRLKLSPEPFTLAAWILAPVREDRFVPNIVRPVAISSRRRLLTHNAAPFKNGAHLIPLARHRVRYPRYSNPIRKKKRGRFWGVVPPRATRLTTAGLKTAPAIFQIWDSLISSLQHRTDPQPQRTPERPFVELPRAGFGAAYLLHGFRISRASEPAPMQAEARRMPLQVRRAASEPRSRRDFRTGQHVGIPHRPLPCNDDLSVF